MNKVFLKLYNVFKDAFFAALRFPLAVLFFTVLLVTAVLRLNLSGSVHSVSKGLSLLMSASGTAGSYSLLDNTVLLISLFASSCLGTALNILLTIARERLKPSPYIKALLTTAGVILPLCVFIYLFLSASFDSINLARVYVTSGILFITAMLLPSINTNNFNFNTICFIGIKAALLSGAIAAVIIGLLFSITGLIEKLFMLEFSTAVYLYLTPAGLFIFFCCFLGYLPVFDTDKTEGKYYINSLYSPGTEAALCYAGAFVYSIYTIIMAVYAANVLLWNQWLLSRVAFVFLIYMIAGACLYMALTPFENRPAGIFRRLFPVSLFFSLLMSGYALYLRLSAYAFTPRRYFAVLLWLFFLAALFIISFRGRKGTKYIALCAAASLLLSILPVFNYKNISVYSQIMRVEYIYRSYGLFGNNKIIPSAELSLYDKNEVAQAVSYITDNDGINLSKWLPADFNYTGDFQKIFGFSQYDWYTYEPETYEFLPDSKFLSAAEYDIVGTPDETTVFSAIKQDIIGKKGRYTLEISSMEEEGLYSFRLIFRRNGKMIIDEQLSPFLDSLRGYLKRHYEEGITTYTVPQSILTVSYSTPAADLRIFFNQVILTDERMGDFAQSGTSLSIQSVLLKEKS